MTPNDLQLWGASFGAFALAVGIPLIKLYGMAMEARGTSTAHGQQLQTIAVNQHATALATVPVSVSPTQPGSPANPPMPFTPKLQ